MGAAYKLGYMVNVEDADWSGRNMGMNWKAPQQMVGSVWGRNQVGLIITPSLTAQSRHCTCSGHWSEMPALDNQECELKFMEVVSGIRFEGH